MNSTNGTAEPQQLTVRALFDGERSFAIPLYQHAYAWGSERTTSAGLSVGLDQFAEQSLDHTHILLIPLPERTDLNHYFEIMNTRGVQLEAHEIAKARLMSVLETTGDESDRSAFATIWDACADMDRYVQQGFIANARSSIFGSQWCEFKAQHFDDVKAATAARSDNEATDHSQETTLDAALEEELLSMTSNGENTHGTDNSTGASANSDDPNDGRFSSILDFPNFLIHTLNLFLAVQHDTHDCDDRGSAGSDTNQRNALVLNDKNLLEYFNTSKPYFSTAEQIKTFAFFMLKTRFIFDMFVIKSDTAQDKTADHSNWSLRRVHKVMNNQRPRLVPAHTFPLVDYSTTGTDTGGEEGDEVDEYLDTDTTHQFQRDIIMLESMNQVTFTSRTSKTFVQDYLWELRRFIVNPSDIWSEASSVASSFRDALWDLALTQFKHSVGNNWKERTGAAYGPNGQDVFTFNFIDYVLWRYSQQQSPMPDTTSSRGIGQLRTKVNAVWSDDNQSPSHSNQRKASPFVFHYRNSIEHFFPQDLVYNHAAEYDVDERHLNELGNLCLLTRAENSKRSNMLPKAKVAQFNIDEQSLKFRIMASITETSDWGNAQIESHTKSLQELFQAIIDLSNES